MSWAIQLKAFFWVESNWTSYHLYDPFGRSLYRLPSFGRRRASTFLPLYLSTLSAIAVAVAVSSIEGSFLSSNSFEPQRPPSSVQHSSVIRAFLQTMGCMDSVYSSHDLSLADHAGYDKWSIQPAEDLWWLAISELGSIGLLRGLYRWVSGPVNPGSLARMTSSWTEARLLHDC